VRLLYRFFEPDNGNIYINGHNIRDVDLDDLRQCISIVPQVKSIFLLKSIILCTLQQYITAFFIIQYIIYNKNKIVGYGTLS